MAFLAASAAVLVVYVSVASGGKSSPPTSTPSARASGFGFPFGSDVAVQIAGLGDIRFKCTADRQIVTTYRHRAGSSQTVTVYPKGRARVRFHHVSVYTAPPQGPGRQTWKIVYSVEPAAESAVVHLTLALTLESHACYVKASEVRTRITPHGR